MKKNFIILIYFLLVFNLVSLPLYCFASNTCDLARAVAKKADSEFKKDMKSGLRLFIKAYKTCPDDPLLTYNLGVAYYVYGSFDDAEKYLKKALEKEDDNANWLNNLAHVMLKNNRNPKDILTIAQKAVEREKSPATCDTLAQAHLGSGDYFNALIEIKKAKEKWPENNMLNTSYDKILKSYLNVFLTKIRDGEVDSGIAGLKKTDFDARAVETLCNVLARLGKIDEAIELAENANSRFQKDSNMQDLLQDMIDKKIRTFYIDFKTKNSALAVQSAKAFSEQYPGMKKAKEAYDALFKAFIEDATSISVPQQVAVTKPENNFTNAENLLAGIGSDLYDEDVSNLEIDVDINIPEGKMSKPYGVAVLIANQRYSNQNRGLQDVKYAERDAAVMRKYLEKVIGFKPENIIARNNVTSGDFRNIFGSKENPKGEIHNYIRKGESELFVYYVGHGSPGPEGKSSYLVPIDASIDYVQNNGYSLDLFYEIIGNIDATEKTVVIDSCFSGDSMSGPMYKKLSPAMLKTSTPVRKLAKAVIFCGADEDQVSTWYSAKRHSMFTYFFLKGIGGNADFDKNNKITVDELRIFLTKEVPYWAGREANRRQEPLVIGDDKKVIAYLK